MFFIHNWGIFTLKPRLCRVEFLYLHPGLRNQSQLALSLDPIDPGWGVIRIAAERHSAESRNEGESPTTIAVPLPCQAPPTTHGRSMFNPMEVKYRSTRGGVSGFSFQEAILSGFAPDGGLFVPDSLPRFSLEDLRSWANLTYPQLIEKFTRLFISQDEIADQEIPGKFIAWIILILFHINSSNLGVQVATPWKLNARD